MVNLIVVAVLLVLLFASTSHWALSQARCATGGQATAELHRAQLWAAIMSFVLTAAVIVGVTIALFTPGATGLERIVAGMTNAVMTVGLVVCAALSLYPACLCARVWRSRSGSLPQRLHLSLHTGALYAVILALLMLPGQAS